MHVLRGARQQLCALTVHFLHARTQSLQSGDAAGLRFYGGH